MYNGCDCWCITFVCFIIPVIFRINVPLLACQQKFKADQQISISQTFLEKQQRFLSLKNERYYCGIIYSVVKPQPKIHACLKNGATFFPTPKLRNAHLECQTKLLLSTASRFRSAVCVCVNVLTSHISGLFLIYRFRFLFAKKQTIQQNCSEFCVCSMCACAESPM